MRNCSWCLKPITGLQREIWVRKYMADSFASDPNGDVWIVHQNCLHEAVSKALELVPVPGRG